MGEDKGLALLKGLPMVTYVIKSIQSVPLVVKMITSNIDYIPFGLPVYADSIREKGPMGGLLTALEHSFAPYVLLIACDMPFVTKKTLCRLIDNSKENMITVALTNGKINPLFAIYPKSILSELRAFLENNQLKMQDFITSHDHYFVKMDEIENNIPYALTNINSQDELEYWNNK